MARGRPEVRDGARSCRRTPASARIGCSSREIFSMLACRGVQVLIKIGIAHQLPERALAAVELLAERGQFQQKPVEPGHGLIDAVDDDAAPFAPAARSGPPGCAYYDRRCRSSCHRVHGRRCPQGNSGGGGGGGKVIQLSRTSLLPKTSSTLVRARCKLSIVCSVLLTMRLDLLVDPLSTVAD